MGQQSEPAGPAAGGEVIRVVMNGVTGRMGYNQHLVTLEQFGLAQAEGFGAQPLYGDLMAAALVSGV